MSTDFFYKNLFFFDDLKYAQEYSEDKKEIKEKKLHKLTIDDLFNYM